MLRQLAVVVVAVVTAGTLGLPAAAVPAEPAEPVVPTQWIAKQFTELLGRAPTTSEWDSWADFYAGRGCSTATLRARSRALLTGAEFAARYSETDKPARIIAITRAVSNQEPTDRQWAAFYEPYADGRRTWTQTVDLYFGARFDRTVRPAVCSPAQPGYGFGRSVQLDVRQRLGLGASRSQEVLQAQLDAAAGSCGTVALAPYEVVRVEGQLLTVPTCVTLTTSGGAAATAYARQGRLVTAGQICDAVRCVDVPVVRLAPGARLRSVWVDAGAAAVGSKTVAVELMGSSAANVGEVSQVRVSDPGPGGTGIRSYGVANYGTPCIGAQITDNLVTGYARAHALDPAARALWADGVSVFCEQATVERNTVVDVGDWGIGLFGLRNRVKGVKPQQSVVTQNIILSAGVPGSVAIGIDAVGECEASGVLAADPRAVSVPCLEFPEERSFAGARVADNTFWTGARTSFDVGLMVGGKTLWGEHGAIGRGVAVTGNVTGSPGARVNVGIAISGMLNALVAGNTGAPEAAGRFTLVDTIGGTSADLPGCPLVAVGEGPPQLASRSSGSQPATRTDLSGCLLPPSPDGGQERVLRTTAGGGSFVGERTGITFTPFGHNYGPTFSHLIDDDWEDPAVFRSIVADFVELRQLGTNILRLHPQFNRFMLDEDTPNQDAFDRLVRLADVAADLGLYLDITGLGIWRPADNQTPWLQNRNEAFRWAAQAVFWGEAARRLDGHPAVLFFNLMNEPVVWSTEWGCPGGTGIFEFCFVQAITLTPGARDPRDIVRAWISQLTDAIRAHDSDVGITVGSLAEYGWPPSWIGDITDLMVSHNYPGEDPEFPGDELAANIAMAKSFKQPGKPLVIEEFFYSLGDGDDVPPNLECGNACLDRFVTESQPEANGWIGHATGVTPVRFNPRTDLLSLGWVQFFQYRLPLLTPCGACQPS